MYFNDIRWFIVGGATMCVSCECYRSQKYKNNFKKKHFVTFFSFVLPWFFKRTPFAFQKDSFCIPKGLLLKIRWISREKWKEKSEESGGLICCIIPFCCKPLKCTPNSIYYRKMKKNSRKSFVFAKNFLPLHPQSSRQDCSNIMLQ